MSRDVTAVLDAIDGALDDYELSPDAMRWEPPWDESAEPVVRDPMDRYEELLAQGLDGHAARALAGRNQFKGILAALDDPLPQPPNRGEYDLVVWTPHGPRTIAVPYEMRFRTGARIGDSVQMIVSVTVLWDEFRRRVITAHDALVKLAAWLDDSSIDEAYDRRLSAMHSEYRRRRRARARRAR